MPSRISKCIPVLATTKSRLRRVLQSTMHPKPLLDICIDSIVDMTVESGRNCRDPSALWNVVRQIWNDLKRLSPNIGYHGMQILHSSLVSNVEDKAHCILILLATDSTKISLVQVERQLCAVNPASVIRLIESGIFNNKYMLQELDLTGIDLGENVDLLLALLPACHNLTGLRLGGNCTPAVLMSATSCNLTVLHVTERIAWNPRIPEELLMKLVIGSSITDPAKLLNDMISGLHPDVMKPSWPGLVDLFTGYCRISLDFSIVALLVLKKLRHFSSRLIDDARVLNKYYDLEICNPSFGRSSLQSCEIFNRLELCERLSFVAPSLEDIVISFVGEHIQIFPSQLEKLSENLVNLRTLRLVSLQHLGPSIIPRGSFIEIGKKLRTLQLSGDAQGINIEDLLALLMECPKIQELYLNFPYVFDMDARDLCRNYTFENMTSLKFLFSVSESRVLGLLIKMFPQLQTLSLSGNVDAMGEFCSDLTAMSELRVLTLSDLERVDIDPLCNIPRDTSDCRRWELHAPPDCLTKTDVAKLRCSGWSFIPENALSV